MKEKSVFWMGIAIMIVSLFIPSVFAETTIFTTSLTLSNATTDSDCAGTGCFRQQTLVTFDVSERASIDSRQGMNFFVRYGCEDIAEFNSRNSGITEVEQVVLDTILSRSLVGVGGTQFNTTQVNTTTIITPTVGTFTEFKEFITMYNKESVVIKMDTFFEDSSQIVEASPCSFEVVLGTQNCNRCKEFKFFELQQDIGEAGQVRELNENIVERMKGLIGINFEIWIIIYWFIMIGLLLSIMGLFYFSMFLVYNIIRHFFGKVARR